MEKSFQIKFGILGMGLEENSVNHHSYYNESSGHNGAKFHDHFTEKQKSQPCGGARGQVEELIN